jgi:2-dehydro-3-deoxygluconokinase
LLSRCIVLPVDVSRVALIGECMIELRHLAADRLALGYAGDVFNTAAYLARSAPALDVQFVSVTGDDPYSGMMRAHWAAYGVGDAYSRVRPGGHAGLYLIRTDAQGERTFQHYRSDSAARDLFSPAQPTTVDDAIASHDLVYLSGITLSILTEPARERLISVLAETRRRGGRVAYDGNYRPSGWPSPGAAAEATARVLAHTDIALPSLDDDRLVHGDRTARDSIDRLRAAGVREIVVKLGPEGCVIADQTSMEAIPAVPATRVVDTTSAGDAFNGAYLAARLTGEPPHPAAQAGAALAAKVIAHPGALLPPRQVHAGASLKG